MRAAQQDQRWLHTLVVVMVWGLLPASPMVPAALGQSSPGVEAMPPADTVAQVPQTATAQDIRVFEPYIGRFQSPLYHDADRGVDLRYTVEYQWVDSAHSTVRFRVGTRYTDGTETASAEGYYGYDPFRHQLYVLGVFAWGTTGFGTVGEFDRASFRRVTWARSQGEDGVTTYVRDAFEVVDRNRFNDVTLVRRGEGGPWQLVYRDSFTRIDGDGD